MHTRNKCHNLHLFSEQLHTQIQTTKKHKSPKGPLMDPLVLRKVNGTKTPRNQWAKGPMKLKRFNEYKGPMNQGNTGPRDQNTKGDQWPKDQGTKQHTTQWTSEAKTQTEVLLKSPVEQGGGHASYAQSYNNPPWQW